MKNSYIKFVFVCLLGLLCSRTMTAQNSELRWALGLHASALEAKTTIADDFFNFEFGKMTQPGLGISLRRYLNPSFDAGLHIHRGYVSQTNATTHFNDRLWLPSLRLRYKLNNGYIIKNEDATIGPFLTAGVGMIMAKISAHDEGNGPLNTDESTFNIYGGAGIRFRLNDYMALEWETGIHMPSGYNLYENIDGDPQDAFLQHSAALVISLGTMKDDDGDDVYNKYDKCPGTPKGTKVDENGCPMDIDKDGVADYQDDCPEQPGSAALKGCPDKDGDGIADREDQCPDEKGTAALQGCPDADTDGVADKDDNCPNTPKEAKVDAKGCPLDTDNDGTADYLDRCPDKSGTAILKGCPDGDGDGIPDIDDRCPTQKGVVANGGCPEIPKEIYTQITKIASKIFFETGSDKLKTSSKVSLDDLADILKQYPEAKLSIEGHTDDVGDDKMNLDLSQKRCESVKNYLVSKGIAAERLTAQGFGETKPIADNKTSDGRAKNRRVELKTQY